VITGKRNAVASRQPSHRTSAPPPTGQSPAGDGAIETAARAHHDGDNRLTSVRPTDGFVYSGPSVAGRSASERLSLPHTGGLSDGRAVRRPAHKAPGRAVRASPGRRPIRQTKLRNRCKPGGTETCWRETWVVGSGRSANRSACREARGAASASALRGFSSKPDAGAMALPDGTPSPAKRTSELRAMCLRQAPRPAGGSQAGVRAGQKLVARLVTVTTQRPSALAAGDIVTGFAPGQGRGRA